MRSPPSSICSVSTARFAIASLYAAASLNGLALRRFLQDIPNGFIQPLPVIDVPRPGLRNRGFTRPGCRSGVTDLRRIQIHSVPSQLFVFRENQSARGKAFRVLMAKASLPATHHLQRALHHGLMPYMVSTRRRRNFMQYMSCTTSNHAYLCMLLMPTPT